MTTAQRIAMKEQLNLIQDGISEHILAIKTLNSKLGYEDYWDYQTVADANEACNKLLDLINEKN